MKFSAINHILRLSPNAKVFLLLDITIIIKCVLFQVFEFNNLSLSPINDAIQFYGSTVAIASVISAFVFLFKNNKWWTSIVQIIIDLWIIANMIYLRSNGLFLNVDDMLMSDNMSGFWDSIIAYLSWKMAAFPAISAIYVLLIFNLGTSEKRNIIATPSIILLCFLFIPINNYNRYEGKITRLFIPYLKASDKAVAIFSGAGDDISWERKYVASHNIVNYFIGSSVYYFTREKYEKKYSEKIQLTAEDIHHINQFINPNADSTAVAKSPLIIILCESLESWAVDYITDDGRYLMPNVHNFLKNNAVFYADKVKSQVKKGISGDGQMLVNTGMLPCNSGAACRLYANNVFPNLAHYYSSSVTLNPAPGIWNQRAINSAYGIKELYEYENMTDDKSVFSELLSRIKDIEDSSFIMAITVDTHAPFEIASKVDFELDPQMPSELSKYMKSVHYLDACMKEVLVELSNNPNAITVITGDHTIFKPSVLQEFNEYAVAHNMAIANGKNYCPLIIKNKNNCNRYYSEECFQMDIFPTILAAIDMYGDYWWRGFGINLMCPDTNRLLDEEEAYSLSDKILRSNYFSIKNKYGRQ